MRYYICLYCCVIYPRGCHSKHEGSAPCMLLCDLPEGVPLLARGKYTMHTIAWLTRGGAIASTRGVHYAYLTMIIILDDFCCADSRRYARSTVIREFWAITLVVTWRHHTVGPMINIFDIYIIQTYHPYLEYFTYDIVHLCSLLSHLESPLSLGVLLESKVGGYPSDEITCWRLMPVVYIFSGRLRDAY